MTRRRQSGTSPSMSRRGQKIEIVELDGRARQTLARRYPTVVGCGNALVVTCGPDLWRSLTEAVHELADAVNARQRVHMERLVEALTPDLDIPSQRALEHARQEAVRRIRVLRDFG